MPQNNNAAPEVVAENPWTTILRESFDVGNGTTGDYLFVHKKPALLILPIEMQGGHPYTYLVSQFRRPIKKTIWQFPLGGLEYGADPVAEARRELQEETGLRCKDMLKVAEFSVDPGLSQQTCMAFVACNLSAPGTQSLDPTEAGLKVRRIAVHQIEDQLVNSQSDGWSFIGLYLILRFLAGPGRMT